MRTLTLNWLVGRQACEEAVKAFQARFGKEARLSSVALALADHPRAISWWRWLVCHANGQGMPETVVDAWCAAEEAASQAWSDYTGPYWSAHLLAPGPPECSKRLREALARADAEWDRTLRAALRAIADQLEALEREAVTA